MGGLVSCPMFSAKKISWRIQNVSDLRTEFCHPSEEFTPVPFWFWNDYLTEEEIGRQMEEFKAKGVDGFVIHPRLGMPEEIGYLSEEYFHYVTFAVEKAKKLHMKVVLYDEAMYPSGSCHGMVVKENAAYASKGLCKRQGNEQLAPGETIIASVNHDGEMYYFIETPSGGTIRGIHYGEDDGEPNAPKSADLLNPEAVSCFIRLTHEKYYHHLKEYFGDTVIAMFTDEPNILGRCSKEGLIPWSGGLFEEFEALGGTAEDLFLMFAYGKEETAKHAWEIYRKVIYDRMSQAYYRQISEWCISHGIGMTGHPEKSTDIGYLQYFTIPCQDIVWRFVAPEENKAVVGEHSTMGKCSSDSARHRGKRRNGNECFGCCGAPDDPYRFTREDMKWYLDWLFVRGVNMIYPHAFYYSLREKRKDERPPEVGMHSVFWEDYREISDYIKRMCGLLTDSVNQTEIAILCGPEELSWQAARPLYENQIEFNYLEEELLSGCRLENGKIFIAEQCYRVVITAAAPGQDAESFLQKFISQGGTVISYHDAESDEAYLTQVEMAAGRDFIVCPASPDLRRTHIKKGGKDFFLVTNEGEGRIEANVTIPGGRITEIWDAENGRIEECKNPGDTIESFCLERRRSLILVAEF